MRFRYGPNRLFGALVLSCKILAGLFHALLGYIRLFNLLRLRRGPAGLDNSLLWGRGFSVEAGAGTNKRPGRIRLFRSAVSVFQVEIPGRDRA
ncbi:hypothetical protein GF1_16540 [Desulfolithobacter dissulfuricans]|uniref:Uncharacterized protein n=1 Tax=Desulfolithobacter dissulfuricans TaxID=2795293 RepID=A0A915U0L4_9BACT|nr:hypothetical protein GF1_16540 [Desulfolithobacter dissulfuricans]